MRRRLAGFVALASLASVALSVRETQAADLKFALAMPHFNVQYVAGGMVGFWPRPDPKLDLSAEQIEDLIIVQSFEPILDLLTAHPKWATDAELQGYMLDIIATRHPGILDKMKKLTAAGQLEVVSFHYSDQLFVAHAPEDWEKSAALNKTIFDKTSIPLGGAVFCQEGQAGTGMAAAMKAHGQSILVWPKNLWSYQHTEPETSPIYKFGDVFLTTSRGGKFDVGGGNTVEVNWTFVDDGELLATSGRNPYTPDEFYKRPAAITKYEDELTALETAGYQITTVSKYLEAVKAVVATPPVPPPLLDGTWQPNSTEGVSKWLGAAGLHAGDERDSDVRTLASIAHREIVAARSIAKKAGIDVTTEIDAAFRLLALGEVSDASGINPFRGEVEYGIAHCTEATRIARSIVTRAKDALGATGKTVSIDSAKDEVNVGATQPGAPTKLASPPLALVVDAGDRKSDVQWTKLASGRTIATIHFGTGSAGPISVKVPGSDSEIAYTPALTTTPVHLPKSAFSFDHFALALQDGLLGIGAGKWLIKDLSFVHLAARVEAKSGTVTFKDETANPDEEITWVFQLFEGDDAAAADAARTLNIAPTVLR